MKKLIFSAAVLASAFFAASCQQEMLDPQAEGTTVTYTVEVPEVATKAIGDGNNVNQLIYAVYRVTGETEEIAKTTLQESELMYQKAVLVSEGKAIVPLELIKDQSYLVLFWAQVENKWFGVDHKFGTAGVRYPSTYVPNSDDYAAFSNVDYISVEGSVKKSITLTRPFGQLNIATNLPDPNLFTPVITGTQVTVEGAANHYDVATGKGTAGTLEFASAAPIAEGFTGYEKYLSMNYVFVPDQQATVSVSYVITTQSHGTVDNTISNVPVKKNYKTNIVGKLLTSDVDYNVTLEKDWADAGKDMVVLADGVVKNINDDYEITTAEGFAYAINKLFADGGTFYIHPGRYDFTGLVVEPKPTKSGAILNVKANEKPVVTRSTPGFEIIGLDVAYLVSEVTNGSQAIFSNLVLPEDTKLVGTNNGVVGVSGCSNEDTNVPAELIGMNGENGKVVNTVSMASVDAIKAAMEQGLKLIELTDDMSLEETLVISKDVTLDGCGHTLTSTAARAINVSGVDANGVTIKNLVIECTGERAINIIQKATNVTIDNVTATAANYTVNVAASAPGAVVNIENSTLNGLCTVNVAAPSAIVTVDNSTINCNDNNTTVGESYAALCLNKDAVGGKIEVTNSTINVIEGSDSRKAKNGAEDGIITIDGSAEEVLVDVAAITFEGSDYYYAYASLDAAFAAAQEHNRPVTLIRNLTVAETVTVEEGQTVVLDLNGKTITGTMPKSVGAVVENNGTLTIQNGTISSTAANGGSAISNNGTLIVKNATINGASVRENEGWPSYPVNNYSDATLENVTVTGYQGAIAANAPGTTTVTNCTINKEYLNTSSHVFYINHADAKVVVNSGTYTHKGMDGSLAYVNKGKITINGGVFSASDGGYGMAALAGGSIEVNGGDFTASFIGWGGTINIMGGTFASKPADALLADGYKAVQNADGKWKVVAKTYVAQIGNEKYESLQEAFATVQDDQTITFLSDVEQADGVIVTDKNITVDLNGKTFTVSEGASTNNRNFKINGSSKVTIKNGTMIAAGELTSGAYGTVRTDGEAVVNLETVKLYSYRGYGLNVKANTGTKINIKDSEIYSQYSGGVEAAGGEIELTNVKIQQRGVYSGAVWCSVAIGVNGGGKVTVNSGDYYAAAIATDSNAAQATWVAYVMSSGGTLDIKGGTFTGVVAETASAANACGLICADRAAVVNIRDGIFSSNGAILDMRNNVGTQPNPVATLYGGNFSADPRVSGLYSSNLIKVAEGKEVVEGADGRWTIQ